MLTHTLVVKKNKGKKQELQADGKSCHVISCLSEGISGACPQTVICILLHYETSTMDPWEMGIPISYSISVVVGGLEHLKGKQYCTRHIMMF